MSKMFPFITKTWNPIGGECIHNCSYCWAKALSKQYDMSKYQGIPRLYPKELKRNFKDNDFVFVQDMSDLFSDNILDNYIKCVIDRLYDFPKTKFLLLTKNPKRYLDFNFPDNAVLGATIESDLNMNVSSAPRPLKRLEAMYELIHEHKMISIEPIMRFSDDFETSLIDCQLEFVAVGYDNYNNGLDEPYLKDTEFLIAGLEQVGIKVYRKTIREKIVSPKESETK